MKRIYKGKSKLRILIDTKCDLSGYEDVSIVFMKPDESQFTVSAVVKDVETGIIFYDVQSEDELDQSGWWTLWPEVRFDDDRTACGRAVRFFVYEAGNG
ncbi:hypothetical protein [Treponema sp.]|uniref:hypothetical protein n=1 Tax=Treponema sp. TaxID=166 RepID=UPI00257D6B6F|nr:hypothetical protein [Treponema sp.]